MCAPWIGAYFVLSPAGVSAGLALQLENDKIPKPQPMHAPGGGKPGDTGADHNHGGGHAFGRWRSRLRVTNAVTCDVAAIDKRAFNRAVRAKKECRPCRGDATRGGRLQQFSSRDAGSVCHRRWSRVKTEPQYTEQVAGRQPNFGVLEWLALCGRSDGDGLIRKHSPLRQSTRASRTALLALSMFCTGASGFIFECVLSTVATYILGNSIEQFSVTISLMLLMMGVAGYWQQRLSDRRLVEKFLAVEVLLAMLGGSPRPRRTRPTRRWRATSPWCSTFSSWRSVF